MLVIGLTGGVATGKSTVADRLKELGAEVIDADRIAREVVEPKEPVLQAIVELFGREVLRDDGHLDRKRLGEIVFSDAEERRRLEAVIHPAVRRRMAEKLDAIRAQGSTCVVVCDIPLLYETGEGISMVDRIVVVDAPPELQLHRLMARNGLSRDEALRRIAAQLPTAEKAERAHYVIDNSGDLGETLAQVDRLWEEWMSRCASH